VMLVVHLANAAQPFGGGLVVQVAHQRIAGIGGYGGNAASVQDAGRLLQKAGLRVFRVDFKVLRHVTNCRYPGAMIKLIVRWVLLAAALLLVANVYPGVKVAGFESALWAALVLGLLNTLVRPVLVLLTFPVTLVTLGLFLFVINAVMFWSASYLLDGLQVTGFWAALIGSVLYSLCAMVIDVAMERLFSNGQS
jgi:putative membrane protein